MDYWTHSKITLILCASYSWKLQIADYHTTWCEHRLCCSFSSVDFALVWPGDEVSHSEWHIESAEFNMEETQFFVTLVTCHTDRVASLCTATVQ